LIPRFLQIIGWQQLPLKFVPGSHCSPASTFPFPQTGLGAPGGLITGGKAEADPTVTGAFDLDCVPETVLPGLVPAGDGELEIETPTDELTPPIGVFVAVPVFDGLVVMLREMERVDVIEPVAEIDAVIDPLAVPVTELVLDKVPEVLDVPERDIETVPVTEADPEPVAETEGEPEPELVALCDPDPDGVPDDEKDAVPDPDPDPVAENDAVPD